MPLASQLILFTSLWFFSTAIFILWFSSAVWQWTFQWNWLAWRSLSPPTRSKSTSLCSPQPLPTSPCWPCWLYSQLASFQIQLLLILVVGVEQLWDLLFKVGEIPLPSSRPFPAPSLYFLCLTCLSFASAFQLIQHHDHLWLSCKHCLLAWSSLLSLLKIKSGSSSLKILVTLNEYVKLWTSQRNSLPGWALSPSFSTLSTHWNFSRDELRVYRVSFISFIF